MKAAPKSAATTLTIPAPQFGKMRLTLVSDSPLICHRFSEKAKRAMLDKQMKKAKLAKEAKDPEADFRASLYDMPGEPGRYGFPVLPFKQAAVDACSFLDGMTKVLARGAFHVVGEYVRIDGSEPHMREDIVKIAMGTTDIRHRAEFPTWEVTLTVRFNASVISPEQIANLFQTAGFSIGVGEWRPQRDGNYGMFHVAGADVGYD